MSGPDIERATAVLRRRPGLDRPARSSFIIAARRAAADLAPDLSLAVLLSRISDLNAEAAALAAVAEQRRDGLGLAETMRLRTTIEGIIDRASLSFDDAARRRAELCTDREVISRSEAVR